MSLLRFAPAGLISLACILLPVNAQTVTETVLHNFRTPPRGAFPLAVLARDSAGNLYGTASGGGSGGQGTVYKVSPAGVQTVLYNFTGGTAGGNPQSGVIFDPAGNLYGTTYAGGSAGLGVVYKVDPSGKETVLYSFKGGTDGADPYAGVTAIQRGVCTAPQLAAARAVAPCTRSMRLAMRQSSTASAPA